MGLLTFDLTNTRFCQLTWATKQTYAARFYQLTWRTKQTYADGRGLPPGLIAGRSIEDAARHFDYDVAGGVADCLQLLGEDTWTTKDEWHLNLPKSQRGALYELFMSPYYPPVESPPMEIKSETGDTMTGCYEIGPWDQYMSSSVKKIFIALEQDFVSLKWDGKELTFITPSGVEMFKRAFSPESATRGVYRLISQWLWSLEENPFEVILID